MNPEKTLRRALGGSRNLRFKDICALTEAFGFRLSRVAGSHHIYTHPEIPELINLQEIGGQAKPYQVRQLLRLVERHRLTLKGEER